MLKIWLLFILTISQQHSCDVLDEAPSQRPGILNMDEQSLKAKELIYKFWKDLPPGLQDERFTIQNMTKTRKFQEDHDVNLEARLIALLDDMTRVKCTGSLITNRWIVTAAHCLDKDPAYAQNQFLQLTTRVNFAYKHIHHVYEKSERSDDVALLKNDFGLVLASEEFNVPDLPSIDVYTRDLANVNLHLIMGSEMVAYGYGRHGRRGSFTRPLFMATLRGVPCRRQSWTPCFCGASIIAGACAGDSGGPVFFKGIQVGITSLGPSRCLKYPGASHTVFTNLQHYTDFLYRTVKAPIDTIVKAGGPNAHWLTPVYFTPRPTTVSLRGTSQLSSLPLRRGVQAKGGCVSAFGFKINLYCLCFFLVLVWY